MLTYAVPFHRKTYDTLNMLKVSGYNDVAVWALPLHYVKKQHPLIEHRPQEFPCSNVSLNAQLQCKSFLYEYHCISSINEIPSEGKGGVFLVCGAGILPNEFVKKNIVINSHPGFIPIVRGLDALKWAIYNGDPVGVSTHIIGDEVDAGEVIERRTVPLHWNDTFHAVAQRQYEMEIQMLVEALDKLNEPHEFFSGDGHPVNKRMPHSYETRLFFKFENIIKNIQITDGS